MRPDATRRDGRRRGRGWALLASSLGFAMVQLDVSVVNVAIRPIGQALGGSTAGLQWVVNAYTVAFAALILSAGALADRLGAKRVFVAGFVLFTIASVACGFAPALSVLIAARTVQGVGAAVLVPCSLTLLNHAYPDAAARARAVGLWAAGASVALSAGPLIGGVLTATLGWRAIFFINLPLGVLGIALTARFAAETPPSPQRRLDLPGQLVAVAALTVLAAAVIQGGRAGFGAPLVVGGLAAGVVLVAAFVLVERARKRPMLPMTLFRSRTFSAAAGIGLLINVAFYGLIFVLSLFFQQAQHLSALTTGLAFAPMTAAVLATNLTASRIAARIGTGTTILIGAALTAAGLLLLLPTTGTSVYWALVGQLVAVGAGLGLVVPAVTAALLGAVDPSRSGVASGALNTARQTGSVFGVAVLGSLIAGGNLVGGLHTGLLIGTALAVVVAALALLIRKEPA